jgi:hypothetical protein
VPLVPDDPLPLFMVSWWRVLLELPESFWQPAAVIPTAIAAPTNTAMDFFMMDSSFRSAPASGGG